MMDGARHFSIIHHAAKGHHLGLAAAADGYAPEENALTWAVRMGDFTNVPGGLSRSRSQARSSARWPRRRQIEQDVIIAKAALAALETPRRSARA